jgi:hypothetical protein
MVYNVPKQTKIAYYTKQNLEMRGMHAAVAELADRTEFDGDVAMTEVFQRYIDGDKTAITRKMTLAEATGGKTLDRINTAQDRMDTLFDNGFAAAEDNFILSLDNGMELPVLGHAAYGGKVNSYGAGQYSKSDIESLLHQVMMSERKGMSEAALEAKRQSYINATKKYLFGKKSFLRGDATDPWGESPRIVTRPSSLRYADGSVNPFEIGIGRDAAMRIAHEPTRNALLNGETVTGMVTREPVSHAPVVKWVIDESLNGSNLMGMDPGVQLLLKGDSDGDYSFRHIWKFEGEAHQEAINEIFGENSIQRKNLAFVEKELDAGEDMIRNMRSSGGGFKSLAKGALADKIMDVDSVLLKRTTSGAVGPGSNLFSLLQTALATNENIVSPELRSNMGQFFFDLVKQAPITAAKHSSEVDMHLSSVLQTYSKIRGSLSGQGDFNEFYRGLGELAHAADQGPAGRFHDTMSSMYSDLQQFHGGFDREGVADAVRAVTAMPGQLEGVEKLGIKPGIFSYVQGAAETAERAAADTAKGATTSASVLGEINQATRAAEEVGRAARNSKLGIIAAAGVAAAAIAGIATTRLGPSPAFGRTSASSYRPEEAHPGRDHVPGDGAAGSRAPAKPPRVVQPAPAQTRTTVVAPLGETRDLDVKLRASDRQRAHRTARMMSQMATDGDSTVTINYRDQMKPKSFRSKERMRDAMEG